MTRRDNVALTSASGVAITSSVPRGSRVAGGGGPGPPSPAVETLAARTAENRYPDEVKRPGLTCVIAEIRSARSGTVPTVAAVIDPPGRTSAVKSMPGKRLVEAARGAEVVVAGEIVEGRPLRRLELLVDTTDEERLQRNPRRKAGGNETERDQDDS